MNPLQLIDTQTALTEKEFRTWITGVEQRMNEREGVVDRHTEGSPIKLKHTFTPGLYTREMFVPAGTLAISRIHLHEHPLVVSRGRVTIYDGATLTEVAAPHQQVTPAGTKRIFYAHTDTTWTTFHVTDKTTLGEVDIDGVITCGTFETFDELTNKEVILCRG